LCEFYAIGSDCIGRETLEDEHLLIFPESLLIDERNFSNDFLSHNIRLYAEEVSVK